MDAMCFSGHEETFVQAHIMQMTAACKCAARARGMLADTVVRDVHGGAINKHTWIVIRGVRTGIPVGKETPTKGVSAGLVVDWLAMWHRPSTFD